MNKQILNIFLAAQLICTATMNFACSAKQEIPKANIGASADGNGGEGSSVRGGGDPKKIEESLLRRLLDSEQSLLKVSMINYLRTVELKEIKVESVKNIFGESPGIAALKKDIEKSRYVISSEESCRDKYKNDIPSSTIIGQANGDICFDIRALAEEYKGLSVDKIMIRLAALAFHEHLHHFQAARDANGSDLSEKNETEAYDLASYVELTARSGEIPILEWSVDGAQAKEESWLSNSKFERLECHMSLRFDDGSGILVQNLQGYDFGSLRRIVKSPTTKQRYMLQINFWDPHVFPQDISYRFGQLQPEGIAAIAAHSYVVNEICAVDDFNRNQGDTSIQVPGMEVSYGCRVTCSKDYHAPEQIYERVTVSNNQERVYYFTPGQGQFIEPSMSRYSFVPQPMLDAGETLMSILGPYYDPD